MLTGDKGNKLTFSPLASHRLLKQNLGPDVVFGEVSVIQVQATSCMFCKPQRDSFPMKLLQAQVQQSASLLLFLGPSGDLPVCCADSAYLYSSEMYQKEVSISRTFHVYRGPQQRGQRIIRQAQAGECCEGHEALVRQVMDAEGGPRISHAVSETLAVPEGRCYFRGACLHAVVVSHQQQRALVYRGSYYSDIAGPSGHHVSCMGRPGFTTRRTSISHGQAGDQQSHGPAEQLRSPCTYSCCIGKACIAAVQQVVSCHRKIPVRSELGNDTNACRHGS